MPEQDNKKSTSKIFTLFFIYLEVINIYYRKHSNNAPGIITETHGMAFSRSIECCSILDVKWRLLYQIYIKKSSLYNWISILRIAILQNLAVTNKKFSLFSIIQITLILIPILRNLILGNHALRISFDNLPPYYCVSLSRFISIYFISFFF